MVSILVAWTLLCYALFQLTAQNEGGAYVGEAVNSRLLLQKVTDSPAFTAPSVLGGGGGSGGGAGDADAALHSARPKIDVRGAPSEEEMAATLQQRVPNVPVQYWVQHKANITIKNHTCAVYPSIMDLRFNNDYWQTLHTSNGTFYLYGAYYDDRARNPLGPTVRILGMIDRIEPTVKTHCLLWYDVAKDPIKTAVVEYKYVWFKKWGNYRQGLLQPYLLACKVPPNFPNQVQ